MSTNSSRQESLSVDLSSEADLQGSNMSAPSSLLSRRFRPNEKLGLLILLLTAIPGKALARMAGDKASLFKMSIGIIC